MNNANSKTTLKDWKSTIISVGVVMNLFLNTVIICQIEDIFTTQKAIIEKENNTYYAIGDATNYLTDEMYKAVNTIIVPEDISCKSGIKSKNTIAETEYDIPNYETSFKTYMDYRCITDKTSAQYMLQMEAYTDDMGLRKYEDHYIVAMGTYYSDNVGDTFKITLDNDISFNVIIGDIKADCHTDSKNMYSPVYDQNGNFVSANVIEFIVDTKKLDRSVKRLGTIEAYDDFKGNIVKIERTDVYE